MRFALFAGSCFSFLVTFILVTTDAAFKRNVRGGLWLGLAGSFVLFSLLYVDAEILGWF